jgi:MFS family permease
MFLAALDQNIVAATLPRVAADLQGASGISWVVSIYLLTSTPATLIYGKLSDLYGRRVIFQIAMGSATLGTFGSGRLVAANGRYKLVTIAALAANVLGMFLMSSGWVPSGRGVLRLQILSRFCCAFARWRFGARSKPVR